MGLLDRLECYAPEMNYLSEVSTSHLKANVGTLRALTCPILH